MTNILVLNELITALVVKQNILNIRKKYLTLKPCFFKKKIRTNYSTQTHTAYSIFFSTLNKLIYLKSNPCTNNFTECKLRCVPQHFSFLDITSINQVKAHRVGFYQTSPFSSKAAHHQEQPFRLCHCHTSGSPIPRLWTLNLWMKLVTFTVLAQYSLKGSVGGQHADQIFGSGLFVQKWFILYKSSSLWLSTQMHSRSQVRKIPQFSSSIVARSWLTGTR